MRRKTDKATETVIPDDIDELFNTATLEHAHKLGPVNPSTLHELTRFQVDWLREKTGIRWSVSLFSTDGNIVVQVLPHALASASVTGVKDQRTAIWHIIATFDDGSSVRGDHTSRITAMTLVAEERLRAYN